MIPGKFKSHWEPLARCRPGAPLAGTLRCICLVLALTLIGCATPAGRAPAAGAARPPGTAISPSVRTQTGSLPSATGCRIDTTRFIPRHPRTAVPVILAPGFLRDQRQLAGLAGALADQGLPSLTLNLCNRRPWGGNPVRDGLDMIAAARELGAPRVIYGGFSAGGLAALVAGRLDPQALGVLTLDLVDNQRVGVGMARRLNRPLIGLAGVPSRCNARNNGSAVFAASPQARLTPIPGASHCDFESPTDWLCQSLCGVDAASARRRRDIIRVTVAEVEGILGLTRRTEPTQLKGPTPRGPESKASALERGHQD